MVCSQGFHPVWHERIGLSGFRGTSGILFEVLHHVNFQGLKNVLRAKDKIIIHPYGGFTTRDKVFALARVLEQEGIRERHNGNFLTTLWNSYKRFETDEHPDVEVEVLARGQRMTLTSDEEGYVEIARDLPVEESPANRESIAYEIRSGQEESFHISDSLVHPSSTAEYGVISDIDDTILETGVSTPLKWKLLVNSLLTRTGRRKSFEGGSSLYQALSAGKAPGAANPFFYVSNSPWNMYNYIEAFLVRYTYPEGVIMLRDFGRRAHRTEGYQAHEKKDRIEFILRHIPDLPFVMIGDAGEADTEIYLRLLTAYPDRIKAILIRQVANRRRNRRVEAQIREYSGMMKENIPVVMFRRPEVAQRFCREMDLI